jgi:hypothetical protein
MVDDVIQLNNAEQRQANDALSCQSEQADLQARKPTSPGFFSCTYRRLFGNNEAKFLTCCGDKLRHILTGMKMPDAATERVIAVAQTTTEVCMLDEYGAIVSNAAYAHIVVFKFIGENNASKMAVYQKGGCVKLSGITFSCVQRLAADYGEVIPICQDGSFFNAIKIARDSTFLVFCKYLSAAFITAGTSLTITFASALITLVATTNIIGVACALAVLFIGVALTAIYIKYST